MKLKNIFGALVAVSAIMCTSSVYAADVSYTVGTPVDISTGAAVEDYTAGQMIAVPVDFNSSTNVVEATGISLNFDTDILTYGVARNATTNAQLKKLGIPKNDPTSSKFALVNGMYSVDEFDDTVRIEEGMLGEAPALTQTKLNIGWAGGATFSLKDRPELYVLFTVNKDISVDDLNKSIVTVNDSECNFDATLGLTGDIAKANACVAAFQVDIDNDAIATQGVWIQSLYAKVGDVEQPLTVCNNDGVSTTYSFPTRVITNTTGNEAMTIDVYAKVSDDEAGTTTTDVKVGTVDVKADSTATDYGTATTITSAK